MKRGLSISVITIYEKFSNKNKIRLNTSKNKAKEVDCMDDYTLLNQVTYNEIILVNENKWMPIFSKW